MSLKIIILEKQQINEVKKTLIKFNKTDDNKYFNSKDIVPKATQM